MDALSHPLEPRKRRGRPVRPGAAAVEFAAIGLVFVTIVLGIIEVGRAFMVKHLLTNAARQACRVGVLPGKTTTQISNTAINALAAQGINGDVVSVQVNDAAAADASTPKSGDEITVIVNIPVTSATWLPFTKYVTGTLSGQYTLRRE